MPQNQPPELTWPAPGLPGLPGPPAVVPMLPTRLRVPGRRAPLPDAVAIRRLAVPDGSPPYDDEKSAGEERAAANSPGRATAADGDRPDQSLASEPPEHRSPASPGTGLPGPGSPPSGSPPSGSPPGRAAPLPGRGSPPEGGWPSQFAQVLAETLAGSRPERQLTPWTTEQARKRIRQLGPLLATDQRPKLRRIMTSAPAADVLELTAVVGFGPRVRMLALRLERVPDPGPGGRWCCTAIESA